MISVAVSHSDIQDLRVVEPHARTIGPARCYALGARGEIEIDPSSYQLKRDGVLVAIEPKAFDVLVYLIENRDRVVPSKELFARFWPPHISATVLSHCVVITRRLLGDDSSRQEMIRTVRGRGYRFVADVVERHGDASDLHAAARETLLPEPLDASEASTTRVQAFVALVRLLPRTVREAILTELSSLRMVDVKRHER